MQKLEFRVFNILNETQLLKGSLPLTPGSSLTWFGFSEEGQLSSYDSKVFSAVFQLESVLCIKPFCPIKILHILAEIEYNMQGVLRVFTSQYGGSWLPLFRFNIVH